MITRDNYEAFYLDYLEGTLSPEMEAAFLAFLEAHPELQIDDDFLPLMEADDAQLTFTEKELLKKEDELAPISAETLDFYLIAELEGLLTPQQQERLTAWIQEHPAYTGERRLYQHTIVSGEADTVIFPNKKRLKQETRIVPLWFTTAAAAASVALIVTLGLNSGGNRVEIGTPNAGQFAFSKPVKHQHVNDSSNGGVQQRAVKGGFGKNKKNQYEQNTPAPDFKPIIEIAEKPIPSPKTNNNGMLLPEFQEQPLVHNHVTEHANPELNTSSDNHLAWQGMTNPIEPITATLSDKLNTTIDFRRKKESEDKKDSGFYLRIGKFELMHKKGGKH